MTDRLPERPPTLHIPQPQLNRILHHSRTAYPLEACGALLGIPGNPALVREAVALLNVAADPRYAFALDPAALTRLMDYTQAVGWSILGYYHSHPNGAAEPSAEDLRVARAGDSDGVFHVIVSVGYADNVRKIEVGAWQFQTEWLTDGENEWLSEGDFQPAELETGSDREVTAERRT